ncbi:MAG: excinuclease subunit [Gemmatimonadetes bacterium]|nr:excinuclease subunit [Gemmatimonadota bacterium]
MRTYCVYILASKSRVLYTGVTNDLVRRMYEHRNHLVPGFTKRYNVDRLVYFETGSDITAVIAREKQIKGLLRSKKIALIERENPMWTDLGDSIFGGGKVSS